MRTLTSVLLALTLSLALSAAPQGPRTQLQNMVDKLELSADQKAKVDPILETHATQTRALRDDTSLSAEDRSKKSGELRAQVDLKLKPILSDDQWKKLEQLREERQAQNKQGKQGKKKQ